MAGRKSDEPEAPPPAEDDGLSPGPAFAGWLARIQGNATRSIQEARALWERRNQPAREGDDPAAAASDATVAMPTVGGQAAGRAAGGASAAPAASGAGISVFDWLAAENGLAAAWADPRRRPWLAAGAASVLVILLLIGAGLSMNRRAGTRTTAVPQAQPAPTGQPAAQQPAQPAPAQPAPAQPAPAQPAPAQPAVPGEQAGQPAAAPAPAPRGAMAQMGLAALPLLLGLFWLLSAWLVDAEARRAFVVREPWGERRTVAYSCLAVGCVFPLILAGLIFAAWGFVQFVLYVANRQSWVAGIQAGALVLLVTASFLLLRNALVRWLAERRAQQL